MTHALPRPFSIAIALPLFFASCTGESNAPERAEPASPGVEQEEAPSAAGGGTVHEYAYLTPATEALVAFLRGGPPPDSSLLADTVTLIVAPEGGGERRSVPGAALVRREEWTVGGRSLLPSGASRHVTLLPGLHASCQPAMLETLAPDLAERPHVGVRLAPSEDAGCLQTWTMTFVFGGTPESPALVAVLYDQWEW